MLNEINLFGADPSNGTPSSNVTSVNVTGLTNLGALTLRGSGITTLDVSSN
jgi:hypothetical protein